MSDAQTREVKLWTAIAVKAAALLFLLFYSVPAL